MKNTFLTLLFCLLVTILFAQAPLETKLQSALDAVYQAHPEAVGILVHVETPEKNISWSGAAGYSNKDTKAVLNSDQPALIASSIKTYVAATMLRLVEEKKLRIDQSIGNLLTEKTKKLFSSDGYDLSTIQIQHLLSHTSGIANYADEAYIEHKDKNPNYRWTRDEQLALTIKKGDPLGKPGSLFSYTDANYLLLTEIMEQVTGLPFYQAMRELLKYKTLGINDTWFPTLEDKPSGTKEMAHQYWSEKNWDAQKMDISWDLYGGGGIACPAKDLALFVQYYFNGKIVEDEEIRNLIFTYIPTKETEVYPYYLGLSESNYHGMKGYGHGGFWGTVMMYFPTINTSIAVYIQDRSANRLRGNVMDALSKVIFDAYADRINAYQPIEEKSEIQEIRETLTDYIEGTANGEPDRLRKAFHPDFNLYTVTEEDSLRIRSGEKYINNIEVGKKNSRVGRIISIDFEKEAAMAKSEIVIPGWRIFTDYFLLLKYQGSWKIIQKSYTWRPFPNTESVN